MEEKNYLLFTFMMRVKSKWMKKRCWQSADGELRKVGAALKPGSVFFVLQVWLTVSVGP